MCVPLKKYGYSCPIVVEVVKDNYAVCVSLLHKNCRILNLKGVLSLKFSFDVIDILGLVFTAVGTIVIGITIFFGMNIELLYTTDNPWMFVLVFSLFGVVLNAIGIPVLVWCIRRYKLNKKAYLGGVYLLLPISDIRIDTTIRVNNGFTYVIEAQYTVPDTGEVCLFRSRPLMHNPSGRLTNDFVKVYVCKPDYAHYYMDIDSILK